MHMPVQGIQKLPKCHMKIQPKSSILVEVRNVRNPPKGQIYVPIWTWFLERKAKNLILWLMMTVRGVILRHYLNLIFWTKRWRKLILSLVMTINVKQSNYNHAWKVVTSSRSIKSQFCSSSVYSLKRDCPLTMELMERDSVWSIWQHFEGIIMVSSCRRPIIVCF